MTYTKENPHNAYFEKMRKNDQDAEIEYARLLKEDEGKTFLDILPRWWNKTLIWK